MAPSDTLEASLLKALGHPLRMRLLTFVAERGEARDPAFRGRRAGEPAAAAASAVGLEEHAAGY